MRGGSFVNLSQFVGYWPLWEAAGTRFNILGDMAGDFAAAGGAPGQRAGRAVYAVNVDGAADFIQCVDDPFISMGVGQSFSFGLWHLHDGVTSDGILAKGSYAAGDYLFYYAAGANFKFSIRDPGGTAIIASAAGILNAGIWNWTGCCFDAQNQLLQMLHMRPDLGILEWVTPVATGARYAQDSAANLLLGVVGGPADYMDGGAAELWMAKRVVTPQEMMAIALNGIGCTFPFQGAPRAVQIARGMHGNMLGARRNRMTGFDWR